MSILVTRPIHQATSLMAHLEEHGLKAVSLPTLEICALNHRDILTTLKNLKRFDQVIFTSANAVEHGLKHWPKNSEHTPTIIAIGPGTRKALRAHELEVDLMPDRYSSEGLLDMPELEEVAGESILIITGKNPRPVLAQTLLERDADVTELPVYERHCPNYSEAELQALMQQDVQMILSTSQESLSNCLHIFRNHPQWLAENIFVVINHKMEHQLKALGITDVRRASDATEQSVLEAILEP